MENLDAARVQMALSLAFHILFACVGMAMPLLMVIAEWRGRRGGDPVALDLARRWSRGTGIMFAVGAVSGTVLSFQLGLLWPGFMATAGPVVAMPFAMEGFAFFLEAIFLGIYLYGWDRVPPAQHLAAGVAVLFCGTASGVFVVTANAWMNTPVGFTMVDGRVVDVDPVAAMTSPAALTQALHMVLAAFATVGFGVAGVHAFMILRDGVEELHRRALHIALSVGMVAIVLQFVSGDLSAVMVARTQPAKLAAMEGHWETGPRAPALLGGWSSNEQERTIGAIPIPMVLSILAFHDPDAVVTGLKDIPAPDRPPSGIVHLAFDVMVGLGSAMMGAAAFAAYLRFRKREWAENKWLLRALVALSPAGFICVEAGWTVTEVGRQPWVIQGVMRTSDAVTAMPGLHVPMVTFGLLYAFLFGVVFVLLRRQVFASAHGAPDPVEAGEHHAGA